MESTEKYADRIAKLLAKAEDDAATPAESEAFVAKAQELMTEYAIDEAMLARARGENLKTREEVIERTLGFKGRYRKPEARIAIAIAQENGCRVIIAASRGDRVDRIYVVGFESDVARVELLDSSLRVQAHSAMLRWWKSDAPDYLKHTRNGFYARRDFMFGFATGLSSQLAAANKIAREQAEEREAERSDSTAEEVTAGVALALRDKAEAVDDWIDEKYSRLRPSRGRSYRGGGAGARASGHTAGQKASTSPAPRVGSPGGRKQLAS